MEHPLYMEVFMRKSSINGGAFQQTTLQKTSRYPFLSGTSTGEWACTGTCSAGGETEVQRTWWFPGKMGDKDTEIIPSSIQPWQLEIPYKWSVFLFFFPWEKASINGWVLGWTSALVTIQGGATPQRCLFCYKPIYSSQYLHEAYSEPLVSDTDVMPKKLLPYQRCLPRTQQDLTSPLGSLKAIHGGPKFKGFWKKTGNPW